MTFPYIICGIITLISAFVSLGFSIAAVVKSTDEARVNALYACTRSLPLAVLSLVPLVHQSLDWLLAVAICMAAVQAFDALIGLRIKDAVKTFGPAITSVASVVSIVWVVVTSTYH